MKIGIGNDHAAVGMKNEIVDYLKELGHEVVNYGTDSDASCSYAVYGEKVARAVAAKDVDLGILICGTGVGISLAANKVKGLRYVQSLVRPDFPDSIIIPISWPLAQGLSGLRRRRRL